MPLPTLEQRKFFFECSITHSTLCPVEEYLKQVDESNAAAEVRQHLRDIREERKDLQAQWQRSQRHPEDEIQLEFYRQDKAYFEASRQVSWAYIRAIWGKFPQLRPRTRSRSPRARSRSPVRSFN